MAHYKKVMLATDFHDDNTEVVARAAETAELHGAELWIMHVIEPLPVGYGVDATGAWADQYATMQTDLRDYARTKLDELASSLDVPAERTVLVEGRAAKEIHNAAKEEDIDLIVLGTHGQHGLGLLLGSTANSVIHGITCDSLVVRIKEK